MDAETQVPLLKMRAWTHQVSGVPSKVLSLAQDVARPSLKAPGEVLVRVHYAALHPGGSIIMQLCPSMFRTKPCIPETDFAGEIVQTGDAVDSSRGLKPGMKVFGSILVPDHLKGQGALAEYVTVDAANVVPAPEEVDLFQAAGLAVSGSTALCLLDNAKPEKGWKILINGAAGGIGTMITQMVRDAVGPEGHIVALASLSKSNLVRSLGANEVIDHRAYSPVHQFLAEKYASDKFDLIIDAYGVQEMVDNCAAFLKEGGSLVTVGIAFHQYTYGSVLYACGQMLKNTLFPQFLGGPARKYVQVTSFVNLEMLERLRKYCQEQKLWVPIDSMWNFGEVPKAYEVMLRKRAKGKIIVNVMKDRQQRA